MEKWRFLEVDWLSYAETAIYRPVLMRAVGEEMVSETVSFCKFPVPSLVLNFFNDPQKDDRIKDMIISGSIHASPLRPTTPIHEIEKALKGELIDKALFESEIDRVMGRQGFQIARVSPELLAQKIYECALS